MLKNKDKGKSKQDIRAEQWAKERKRINWDVAWKVLASIFAFAGSMVAVYELVNYFRSDSKTFYSIIFPGLGIIIWVVVLVQLIRKKNPYAILLLSFTVLGGVVGGIGLRSYNQTQEDKVIVLVAQFDGPEDDYHLRDEILKQLKAAIKDYSDTSIVPFNNVITEVQGSEHARAIGEKEHADLVIWAWYTKTENSNLNLYIENLSPGQILVLEKSQSYRPVVTLDDLESLRIQQRLGVELSDLVVFLTGYLRYQSGDYQSAMERFDQLTSETTTLIDQADILMFKGLSYLNLVQFENAIENYSNLAMLEPANADAYKFRGIAYAGLGQYDHSLDDSTKAIQLAPGDFETYAVRGAVYAMLGDNTSAVDDFSSSLALKPDYASAYYNRGIAHTSLGQYEKAVEDYSQTVSLKPDNTSDAYNNRGVVYMMFLGRYDLAVQDFNRSLEAKPDVADTLSNRGNSYAALGEYDKAFADFKKALEIEPDHLGTYMNRGLALQAIGEYKNAIADYTYLIEIAPELPQGYYNRANVYRDLGNLQQALDDYNYAIKLDPSLDPPFTNRGITFFKLGQYQAAIMDYNRAISLNPGAFKAYLNRANAYATLHQYDQAIDDFTSAIQINPDLAEAYVGRGLVYQKLGKTAEAEADFNIYEELTREKP